MTGIFYEKKIHQKIWEFLLLLKSQEIILEMARIFLYKNHKKWHENKKKIN